MDRNSSHFVRLLFGRKLKRVFLTCLLSACGICVFAQKRIEADFVQTRYLKALVEPFVQKGHFVYLYPDSVHWSYEGMNALRLPEQLASLISLTARGDTIVLKKNFKIEQKGHVLFLYPLRAQLRRIFSSMEISIGKSGVAEKVVIVEPTQDRTEIVFNNIRVKK